MNKADLVAAIAAKAELPKTSAEAALNAFTATVAEAMAKDDKVTLIGFGTFEAKKRAARQARNPRTGETVKIAASKAPVFKAGKALKETVNAKKGKKK